MVQPETFEQFRLTNDFIPTDAIAVIFAAGTFDAAMRYEFKRMSGKIEDLQQ